MLRIREIDHIVLRVTDLAAMLHFYRDVLGCPLDRDQGNIGLTQLRAGRSLIDLVTVDSALGRAGGAAPGAEGRNLDHVCLRLEEFDGEAIAGYLATHGVEVGEVESRYGADGQGPSMYIKDPEGNTVELKGPPWAPDSKPSDSGRNDAVS
jgi:catechol 2,3-dioxygenase-like lactoylglutathione lyase family enzyme